MGTTEILEQALKLKASERYILLEMLHQSLDKPDPRRDEVLRRVKAYDEGKLATVNLKQCLKICNETDLHHACTC